MKRLLLAVVLVAAFARADVRAEQDDAMDSLVGMAEAAKTDKGPEAEKIPADRSGDAAPKTAAPEPLKTDEEPVASQTGAEGTAPKPEPQPAPAPVTKREKADGRRENGGPAVAVPAVREPRLWTKVFSSLLPQPVRPPSFEVAASTKAARSAAPRPVAVTVASTAGSVQGMLEVFSAANAPYGAEETMRDAVAEKPSPRR